MNLKVDLSVVPYVSKNGKTYQNVIITFPNGDNLPIISKYYGFTDKVIIKLLENGCKR